MGIDVRDLQGFYDTPLGVLARKVVGRVLAGTWEDVRGLSLLGLGYATPYLPVFSEREERAIALTLPGHGAVPWIRRGLSASVVADPSMMPFAEGAIDRVLVVHALEAAESPAEFLYEVARILAPSGRLILVCPNRRGLWARLDTTPFGQGQPFSRRQLRHLLRAAQLAPERWAETLYVPPVTSRLVLRSAGLWERCGAGLSLPFAGLHVVEASKQWQRPVPVGERRRRSRVRPVFVPVPASRSAMAKSRT